MHLSLSATAVLGLAVLVHAIPSPSSHVVHEKRHEHASRRWVARDRVPAESLLPMRIGLTQNNLHLGHDLLMDISHPTSPNFGKHFTADEVIEMFKPHEDTVAAVKEWLTSFGISEDRITHSDNKGWLAFDAAVEEAEALLKTEFFTFEHHATGAMTAGCEQYHVPQNIQEHIDYITPGVKMLAPGKREMADRAAKKRGISRGVRKIKPLVSEAASNATNLTICDRAMSPACIKALYQIEYLNGTANPDNTLGIYEEGDYYAQDDLDMFFEEYAPWIPTGTGPIPAFIDGAEAPVPTAEGGGESDLDFQMAYPIIYPQQITLYQTDDRYYATGEIIKRVTDNDTYTGPYGGFNEFLDALDGSYCTYSAYGETGDDPDLDPIYPDQHKGGYKGKLMCGVYKPTNVISVSYGGQELDVPDYYQKRQCNEYLKLGLQGHSVLYASGDDGVAGYPDDDNTNGCYGEDANIFSPGFPNTCPYVTNVGATKVYPGHSVFDEVPESAVNDPAGHPYKTNYSSGGGFSNVFGVPDYQAEAVEAYFAANTPPFPSYTTDNTTGVYNRTGRGIPDVAANGDNDVIYYDTAYQLTGGTSAATPIFAAILTLINEHRLALNKSTIGFVNPTLYANPQVLNDIVNGSNPGCGTDGFSAVKGWDPVTGLGTPNYPKMLDLWLSLP